MMLKRDYFFQANIVDPLLIIGIPLLFNITIFFVIFSPVFVVRVPFLLIPGLLIVSAVDFLYARWLVLRRDYSFIPRIREFLIIILVLAGIYFLVHLKRIKESGLFFDPLYIPVVAAVCTEWGLGVFIQRRLYHQEYFLRFFFDVPDEKIKSLYYDRGHESADALHALKDVKRLITILSVIVSLFIVIFTWILGISLSILWFILFFALMICAMTAVNNMIHSHMYLIDGFILKRERKIIRIVLLAVFGGVIVIFSGLATGKKSILPDSILVNLFTAISRIHLSGSGNFIFENFNSLRNERLDLMSTDLSQFDDIQPVIDLGYILKIVSYALLIGAGIWLVYFIIKPLLKRETRTKPFPSIFSGLRQGLKYIIESLKDFFSKIKKMRHEVRSFGIEYKTKSTVKRKIKVPRRERRVLSQLVREFMRVADAASRRGVSFLKSSAPLEYAYAVSAVFPVCRDDMLVMARIFEEAVFSTHGISPGVLKEYGRRAGRAIKSLKRR